MQGLSCNLRARPGSRASVWTPCTSELVMWSQHIFSYFPSEGLTPWNNCPKEDVNTLHIFKQASFHLVTEAS